MTDKETFMKEMHSALNPEVAKEEIPVSPPTVSMRNDIEREDTQIPKSFRPKCHRTNHTSWRGGANRR